MQHNQETPQPEPLMTIKQVQKMLGLSRSMVYMLIQRGELRVIHIGTAVRVKPSEIRRFVQVRESAEQAGQGRNQQQERKQRMQGTKHRSSSLSERLRRPSGQ